MAGVGDRARDQRQLELVGEDRRRLAPPRPARRSRRRRRSRPRAAAQRAPVAPRPRRQPRAPWRRSRRVTASAAPSTERGSRSVSRRTKRQETPARGADRDDRVEPLARRVRDRDEHLVRLGLRRGSARPRRVPPRTRTPCSRRPPQARVVVDEADDAARPGSRAARGAGSGPRGRRRRERAAARRGCGTAAARRNERALAEPGGADRAPMQKSASSTKTRAGSRRTWRSQRGTPTAPASERTDAADDREPASRAPAKRQTLR